MKNTAIHTLRNTHFRLLVFILFLFPLTAFSQWQATMVSSLEGVELEYRVYSDLNQYRLEFEDGDSYGAVIVDPKENITSILFPESRKVRYVPTNGNFSLANDPVQSYNYYLQSGKEKIEATEKILGYDCIKKTIYKDGEAIFTLWFSEELNFPVKQVIHTSEYTEIYLKNIQAWDLEASKFSVPADFIEVDQNRVPVKK